MKKAIILISLILAYQNIYAYFDFSAVCSTGQTLYYRITGSSTIVVTYPGNMGRQSLRIYDGQIWRESMTDPYCDYETESFNSSYCHQSYTYAKPMGKIRLPVYIQYNGVTYRVTGVSDNAFYGCNSLTLIVPEGMTIGNWALSGVTSYCRSNLYHYDSLYYENSTMTRVVDYDDSVRNVTIPNTVTSIIPELFKNDTILQSVAFGSGLSVISKRSFQGCNNLRSLLIPDNITTIDSGAFDGCSGNDSLSIGVGLTNAIGNPFSGCTGLRSLFFNARRCIFSLGYLANNLTNVVFGDSVKYIPPRICQGGALQSVVIPNGVDTIGEQAFEYSGLVFVNIPNSVKYIGVYAFGNCTGLVSVSFPDSLKSIGPSAFRGCTSLASVIIPDGVDTIEVSAFYGCAALDSVYIGVNVDTIGFDAFGGIDSIHYVHYNAKSCGLTHVWRNQNSVSPDRFNIVSDCYTESHYSGYSAGGWYYYYYPRYSVYAFAFGYKQKINKLIIGDSVQHISQCAFSGDTIDTLILGENISTISDWAFDSCVVHHLCYNIKSFAHELRNSTHRVECTCNNVTYTYYNAPFLNTSIGTITIGDSVRIIPDGAFRNSSLQGNVIISDNVVAIGWQSFSGCNDIDSIYLGCSIDTIGTDAFSGCNNVRSICYNIRNCKTGIFAGNIFSSGANSSVRIYFGDSIETIPAYCFQGIPGITDLDIDVDSIGEGAFSNCDNLYSATINARYIGKSAFAECDRLFSVSFGDSVHTIDSGAFYNCDSLHSAMTHARYIGKSAFAECDRLSSVTFGDSVYTIDIGAFYNCDNIISLNANKVRHLGRNAFAGCDRLVTVTLGDSVRTLGNGAFSGCLRLQNIDLGGVTTIGDSAFKGCVRLAEIQPSNRLQHIGNSAFLGCPLIHGFVLPEGLISIGGYAFSGCGSISGVLEFPSTITSIGDYAFRNNGTITGLRMYGSTPPTIYAHTFASVSNSRTVSVPCGAVMNYYTTDYWENFSNIVEAPPYRLTVSSNDAGMGSATVAQQPTCSNHTARIQATALSGYHFLQWQDGNTANPRTIQMTQDSTFTAIFVVNNSYITVHANDSTMGSVSGTGLYSYNAPVTLTATAYSGYHFLRWNDGVTQNPRYLVATRDTTFTAIFVSNVSTLTVANANPTMGNVSGSGVYYYQNLVSITATPNYGYHFTQWNDGNTQNPRTITISQDTTFTAYFALNTYSIIGSSNSTTMGSVTGGGVYTYLHSMSLTATPAYGYHFVQWNDQVTDNPRTITVTRDSTFTAQFAANSYSITAIPNDPSMGSVYGSGTYNYNTTATLTAVETYGYHFTQWSDGVTSNPRVVTVQNNATYTAQFAINSYILTVQSSNPAIGTAIGGGSYSYLTPVTITALPNVGYHFTQWSDGNTDNPRLVSVVQNATYTAQFAINSYAVGVTSSNTNMGSVSGSGTYNHNSTATLSATAYYGYHFVQWQDGNTQNPRTVVVTDSAQYTAQFDYNSYLITANSSNVTLGTATGGGSYNYLSQVALTAVPAPHYHFTMWNDSIEDNPRTVTVTRDSLFTAHFAIDRHTIVVNSADTAQGTVGGSDTVNYNTAVWISATPNYGYHFTQWQDGNIQNPRRVVVTQDRVFTASFAPNQYSATCAVNDNTRGTVTTVGGQYSYLTSLTFTAVPTTDYHFLRWSNGNTNNPITFTLTKDTALTAILVGLTAQVNDSTMGTVAHNKPSNLVETVTATANYGYHFAQWHDGNTDNPRTFILAGDTTVTAQFAINQYLLTVGVNEETMGTVDGTGNYDYLSQVTVSATAAQHCHFVQWSDGSTTNPRMVTVTRDTAFTAIFAADEQFRIAVAANDTARGSVEGGGMYYLGETVTIAATANEHYYFAQWSDGMTSNPRVVTVTGDVTYTAVFEPVMYTLTVAANDYAMGQVAGGGSYAYGTEVTIEARAFGGYRFLGWDDGVMDEQRTVTVTANASYTALFERNTGIGDVEAATYKVYAANGFIVVEGVENKRVQIFDITGRKHNNDEQLPAGVYLVRIDNAVTKKVVLL